MTICKHGRDLSKAGEMCIGCLEDACINAPRATPSPDTVATPEDLEIATHRTQAPLPHGLSGDLRGYERRNKRLEALASHLRKIQGDESLKEVIEYLADGRAEHPRKEGFIVMASRVDALVNALRPLLSNPKGGK